LPVSGCGIVFLESKMSVGTIILIILVIVLLGGFSGLGGGPFYGTGYYGGWEDSRIDISPALPNRRSDLANYSARTGHAA
jgi:hypothetical protein